MAAYANRGYRQTGFRSEIIYPEPGRVNITYFLRERLPSPRSFTGQVILTGNHSTREDLIQDPAEGSHKRREIRAEQVEEVLQEQGGESEGWRVEIDRVELSVYDRLLELHLIASGDPLSLDRILATESNLYN